MSTVVLKNQGGFKLTADTGFSWTYLLFGFFVPMYRGEIIIAFSHMFLSVCSIGISHIVFAFVYNEQYIRRLTENGYVIS